MTEVINMAEVTEVSEMTEAIENISTNDVQEETTQFFYNPCFEKPTVGVYCPPLNREFIGVYVTGIEDETMYKIIGKEGKVFKAISHQTGVDYIFWLKEEQMIAIWGFGDSLPYAVKRLQDRINLVLSNDMTHNYEMQFPPLTQFRI
jgi:hypothetical protein